MKEKERSQAKNAAAQSSVHAKVKTKKTTGDVVKQLERRKRVLEERLEEIDDRIRWRNFIARNGEVSSSKVSEGEESELEALEAAFAEFTAFRYGTAYSEAFSEAPDMSLTKHEKVSPTRGRTDVALQLTSSRDTCPSIFSTPPSTAISTETH